MTALWLRVNELLLGTSGPGEQDLLTSVEGGVWLYRVCMEEEINLQPSLGGAPNVSLLILLWAPPSYRA